MRVKTDLAKIDRFPNSKSKTMKLKINCRDIDQTEEKYKIRKNNTTQDNFLAITESILISDEKDLESRKKTGNLTMETLLEFKNSNVMPNKSYKEHFPDLYNELQNLDNLFMREETADEIIKKIKEYDLNKKKKQLIDNEMDKCICMEKLKKRFPDLAFKLKKLHIYEKSVRKRISRIDNEKSKLSEENIIGDESLKKKISYLEPTNLFDKINKKIGLDSQTTRKIMSTNPTIKNEQKDYKIPINMKLMQDNKNKEPNFIHKEKFFTYNDILELNSIEENDYYREKELLKKSMFKSYSKTNMIILKCRKKEVIADVLKKCDFIANANNVFTNKILKTKEISRNVTNNI